jgi:Holin of 3TMs, for gene-transfer release
MDITGIGEVATAASKILGMFFPDKTEEEKARMAQAFAMVQGQLDANKEEAKSTSFWTSGWRPGVGWVCVAALGMIYISKAVVPTFIWTYQCFVILHGWNGTGSPSLPLYPDLGVSDLIGLLLSMLGMGGMRMVEKLNGVASK